MTCDPSIPSLSATGVLDYCTANGSCPFPIAWSLRGVDAFECQEQEIVGTPPGSATFTPTNSPANMVFFQTPQAVTVALNGSADTFVARPGGMLLFADISSIAVTNDQLDPPQDVRVSVIFGKGDV